jgi:hypothetical protein
MRWIAGVLSGIALLGGCSDERITSDIMTDSQSQKAGTAAASETSPSEEQKDLATLRQVTVKFHDFDAAKQAGWSTPITACMTDPTAGGMGFHYGRTEFINGSVRVDEPELLLYEPEKNGRLRLVAVEYIVPLTAWTAPNPPRLFGRDFKVNAAFGIWALHAWVWEDNPSGMYADWNPRVNCDNTTDVAASMAHN